MEEEKEENEWRLYEAYNELHALAQELHTPFDAPAVLVVGHQTDGKSALVEALMGFQFNHVGGGTKTRRPITLHMKYGPHCESPSCYLLSDDDPSLSHQMSLPQIQVLVFFLFTIIFNSYYYIKLCLVKIATIIANELIIDSG
jgi:hypothetical protein